MLLQRVYVLPEQRNVQIPRVPTATHRQKLVSVFIFAAHRHRSEETERERAGTEQSVDRIDLASVDRCCTPSALAAIHSPPSTSDASMYRNVYFDAETSYCSIGSRRTSSASPSHRGRRMTSRICRHSRFYSA